MHFLDSPKYRLLSGQVQLPFPSFSLGILSLVSSLQNDSRSGSPFIFHFLGCQPFEIALSNIESFTLDSGRDRCLSQNEAVYDKIFPAVSLKLTDSNLP